MLRHRLPSFLVSSVIAVMTLFLMRYRFGEGGACNHPVLNRRSLPVISCLASIN